MIIRSCPSSTWPTVILVLLMCVLLSRGGKVDPKERFEVAQRWVKAAKTFDRLAWPQTQLYTEILDTVTRDKALNISQQCRNSLTVLSNGLQKRKLWALKFFDSTGKGRSGLAYGYISDIGNLDECISIDEKIDNSRIAGQYCMVQLNLPMMNKSNVEYIQKVRFDLKNTELEDTIYEIYAKHMEMMMYTPTTFRAGLCIPSACSRQELINYLDKTFNNTELTPVVEKYCETKDMPTSSHHRIALYLSAGYVLFVIVANLITGVPEKQETFLEHFSVVKNTEKLTKETQDPLSQRISFLHGVRFYYQVVVISAHICDIQPFLSALYPIFYDRDHNWLLKQLYRSTGFFIQIPFAVSGCLTCCMLYPFVMKRKGKISFIDLIFKRWFRTTPTLLGVLLFSFAWAGFGYGPTFRDSMDLAIEKCTKNWWHNLLYINNWMNQEDLCLFHTWTYSADFQLYILSFVVLIAFAKKQIYGLYAIFTFMFSGMALSAWATWYKDMPPYPNFDATEAREYELAPWIYFHPYHHLPAYMLGFLCGWCVIENKKISNFNRNICWILLNVFGWPMILYPHYWATEQLVPERWQELLYAGVHRIIFVCVFVWTGYLTAFDMGGPFQWLYNIKLWIPFGRMSGSVFLAHFTFIWYDIPNGQQYIPTRTYEQVMKFCYTLVMSWIYSYAIYLLFEAPSMSWAKVQLRKELASQQAIQLDESETSKASESLHKNEPRNKLKGA